MNDDHGGKSMLDKFWESPLAGLLKPLRRSLLAWAAMWLAFVFLGIWTGSSALILLGVFAGPALFLFLSTEGRTVMVSAAHDAAGGAILLQAVAVLREAGFVVSARSETALTARRGSDVSLGTLLSGCMWDFWVEPEWRDLPVELSVTVKTSDTGSLLEVRGRYLTLPGVGSLGESVKALLAKTTAAVAALDPAALAAADGSAVIGADFGVRFGGLAMRISLALLVASLLSMGALIWRGHAWLWQEAAVIDAVELKERARDMRLGLTATVAWAIEDEAAAIRRMKELWGLSELTMAMPATVASFPLFVGTAGENGLVQFQPRAGVKAIAPAGIVMSSGSTGVMIQDLAGGLFYGQNVILSEPAARSLGKISVVLGTVLTFSDIERLAPIVWPMPVVVGAPTRTWWLPGVGRAPSPTEAEQSRWLPAELVIWREGKPVVRLDWYSDRGRGKVRASKGEGGIPDAVAAEILAARARQASPSNSRFFSGFEGVFSPLADRSSGLVREENRTGKPWLAVYFLGEGRAISGFSGYSFAAANSPHRLHWALVQYEVGFFLVVMLVILVVWISGPLLSVRITRPIFEIKDALKSIVEGNFSVRLEIKGKDELSQLAALVNKTAEGLKRCGAINELLGKYMSRQAAEAVLKEFAAPDLASAQREVSVLFADLRGFAGVPECRSLAAVAEGLNEYMAVMADLIASHEGVLSKHHGDGLIAVFSATQYHPDHARRAIITALEIQEAFQSLNLKRVRRGVEPIAIGIGIDTGMTILGGTGTDKRLEFPMVGDAAKLASRLTGYPLRGKILIGPGAFEKVKGTIEYEALGKVAVEGKSEPVEAWLVVDFKARPGRS